MYFSLIQTDVLATLPEDVSPSHSVKYVPGDPASPYVDPPSPGREGGGSGTTTPSIPVVSLSYKDAKVLLYNYTDAHNVSDNYWFGLALKEGEQRNFTASVEVNRHYQKK